jgi:hypothetical protein
MEQVNLHTDGEVQMPELVERRDSITDDATPEIKKMRLDIGARMHYDESPSMARAMIEWHGTIFKEVLTGLDVWFFVFLYVGCIFTMLYLPQAFGLTDLHTIASLDIKTMGTLTTFILVFFNGHCYIRFTKQYEANMQSLKALRDFDLVIFTMTTDKEASYQASRYLQAAHILGWMNVDPGYENASIADITYDFMKEAGLLSEDEIAHLRDNERLTRGTPRSAFVVLRWCLEVFTAQERAGTVVPGPASGAMRGTVRKIGHAIHAVYDLRECYVPFQYYHALNLCSVLFLAVYALQTSASSVTSGVYVSNTLGYVFSALTIISLRKMSAGMMWAYGDDTCDLPAGKFINKALGDHFAIVQDHFQPQHEPNELISRVE